METETGFLPIEDWILFVVAIITWIVFLIMAYNIGIMRKDLRKILKYIKNEEDTSL